MAISPQISLPRESPSIWWSSYPASITDLRKSSTFIHVGTSEIANGNVDLSTRTEQQAAALIATVKQNADDLRQTSSLARDASTTADP